MEDYEKIAKEAFERGKEDSYIPQDPFVSFGFESNPFLKTSVSELRKQSFLQPRVRKISHYIGKVFSSCLENKNDKKDRGEPKILDGVLFGSSQTGISTLIRFTCELLKQHQEITYVDAQKLVEFDNFQYSIANTIHNFRNVLGDLDTGTSSLSLVIIDHADYLIDFFESFRDAFDRDFQGTPLVFIFSHSGWTRLKSNLAYSNYDIHNKIVQSTHIDPLTRDEITHILKMKLSKKGHIQQPFSQEVLSLVAQNSGGSILNAIKMCMRICEECFYNGMDTASISLVHDVSIILNIQKNKEFYNLITLKDNTQTFILSLISMKSIANNFGITYDDIVLNTDIQKTSVSHHLKQLEEKQFVSKQTVNRKAFYKLRNELVASSDTFLLPKFEQKEKYVRLENISDIF